MSNQEELTSNANVALVDIEAFLSRRGCSPKLKSGLEISTAPKGSGKTDISINHDQILGKLPNESQF